MSEIYKLQNKVKHYEWGSPKIIPEFLGIDNKAKQPFAEMWMGAHGLSPSFAQKVSGGKISDEKKPLNEIAGDLPFLFKLIAVEKALSIQAHPDKKQAQEGFALEEKEKLDLNAPRRNYKDPNHKPEILCALSPFTLMAGFREIDDIKNALEEFSQMLPHLKEIFSALLKSLDTGSLAVFFRILFDFSDIEKEYLSSAICARDISQRNGPITAEQWKLLQNFAKQYPNDPAIISPLFLNLFTVQPGQSIFIPAGVLHSYISGFALELMVNSDNVLRCGLTPKHKDIPELMNIVNFNPYMPLIISPPDYPNRSSYICYQHDEFALLSISAKEGSREFSNKGPAICLVIDGEARIEGYAFKKGDSFFIPRRREEDTLGFCGSYTIFAAVCGNEELSEDTP